MAGAWPLVVACAGKAGRRGEPAESGWGERRKTRKEERGGATPSDTQKGRGMTPPFFMPAVGSGESAD